MSSTREYWKEEEELILKDWADKAQCYEILHSKSHEVYNRKNTLFVIPVIIISTLTGTANFAQDRVPSKYQNIFVMVVGSFNILAAIITTISQYLKIAELNESYRVGTLSWGKFYRNIKTELAKHPLDRMPAKTMLKLCKEEFERLLEVYPGIPKNIIKKFNIQFKDHQDIAKPEICDVVEPTLVYNMSREERDEMIGKMNRISIVENLNEMDTETSDKINKFKQTYYKINNRLPTEDEIKQTFSDITKDNEPVGAINDSIV